MTGSIFFPKKGKDIFNFNRSPPKNGGIFTWNRNLKLHNRKCWKFFSTVFILPDSCLEVAFYCSYPQIPHSTLWQFPPPQSLSTAIRASLQLFCYYCVQHFSKQNSSKQKYACASANTSTKTFARQVVQIIKTFNCVGLSCKSDITFNVWASSSDHSYASSLFTGWTDLSYRNATSLKIARQLGHTRVDDSHS